MPVEAKRRQVAIMFTDIVGYTALMGQDEDRAFEVLRKNRKIHRTIIEKFNGEWLKEMGYLQVFQHPLRLFDVQEKYKEP